MSRLYRNWSTERLQDRVDYLEEQLSLGVDSITNPDTGTTSYNRKSARQTVNEMNDIIDRRAGLCLQPRPVIRPMGVRIIRDY